MERSDFCQAVTSWSLVYLMGAQKLCFRLSAYFFTDVSVFIVRHLPTDGSSFPVDVLEKEQLIGCHFCGSLPKN
jgi:hypothetical protein